MLQLEPNNKLAQAEIEEVNFLRARSAERVSPAVQPIESSKMEESAKSVENNLKNVFNKSKVPTIPGQVFPIHKPPHQRLKSLTLMTLKELFTIL